MSDYFGVLEIPPGRTWGRIRVLARLTKLHGIWVTADIEQPLTMGNLIKPANGFPKQAKDFNLHVVETYNEVLELALHRHADAMNPFQELEHPTQGGSLGWLVDLVGERLVLTSQLLAQSALRHRIDQQR